MTTIVTSTPQVWRVDCLLLVLGGVFVTLALIVY